MLFRPFLILTVALLLVITLYYGVIFDAPLPNPAILHSVKNDLVLHFCAFAALILPARILWKGWRPLAALAFCATAVEAIQIFQPHRTAALDDLAASLSGILVGAAFIELLLRGVYSISSTNYK